MRAVGYVRVSTEHQIEKGDSISVQEANIKEYCRAKGWKVVDIYRDEGVSAGTSERPAYKQMLRDLKHDGFDIVVVTKIDRLSRNIRDFILFLDLLEEHNKGFVSITQNFDTSTPMGRLTLNVLISFAQFEREMISERIKEVISKKALKGDQWMGGAPPMGYMVRNKRLVVNEDEAELVREIFKTYIAVQSPRQTASILTSRGYRYRGRHISPTTVARVIESTTYIGEFVWGKRKVANGKIVKKPKGEWIVKKGMVPPIVDEEIFRKANQVLRENREKNKKSGKTLLSGMLYCKKCGSKLYRATSRKYKKQDEKYNYYKCKGVFSRICNAPPVQEERLDGIVIKAAKKLYEEKEIFEKVLDMAKAEYKKDANKVEKLKEKRKKLVEKSSKLIDLYIDGVISKSVFEERNASVTEKIRSIESEISLCEEPLEHPSIDDVISDVRRLVLEGEAGASAVRDIFSTVVVDTERKEAFLFLRGFGNLFKASTSSSIPIDIQDDEWDVYLSV